VKTVGFPYSISPTFLENNQKQSMEDAIEELEKIEKKADEAGMGVVVYISMAFGNPYGDLWNVDEVVNAVELLESLEIKQISLADTVGLATPQQVAEVFAAVNAQYDYLEVGCHVHSRPDEAAAKVLAAYDAGCRRFDSAIGGLGGCPFAQDELIGNIPTERVLEAFKQRELAAPIRKALDNVLKMSADIAGKYGTENTESGVH
jgi:hydroxymethylglutaryl-CoA lyase